MKLRIDYDLAAVPARLAAWGHPYAAEWDLVALSQCLVAKIVHTNEHDAEEIVGYVWYHWRNHWAKNLEMHIAVSPAFHGRWHTRRVRDDVFMLARLCDARTLSARDNSSLKQKDLLRRSGFEYIEAADWWVRYFPENY